MTGEGTPIDAAFDRYSVLSSLLAMELKRARANPQDRRYVDLGITADGDTKKEASTKFLETLDGLAKLVEHVAILDMVSSFERLFRTRIGTVAGMARSAIKKELRRGDTALLAAKLVRGSADFEGLREMHDMLGHLLSVQASDALVLMRHDRNTFAHGTDLSVPPTVEPAQARDNLNEIASSL